MTAPSAPAAATAAPPAWVTLAGYLGGYQVIWGLCIGFPESWLGPLLALVYLGLHAARCPVDLPLMLAAALGGWLLDSLPVALELLRYRGQDPSAVVAPLWIALQWGMFSVIGRVALGWLHHRLIWAAALGGSLAPLAYGGGAQLGAAILLQPSWALMVIGVNWAVALPLLCLAARQPDGLWRGR